MIKIVDNRTAGTPFDDLSVGSFFEDEGIVFIKLNEEEGFALSADNYGFTYGFSSSERVTKLKVTITIEGAE